MKILYIVPYAPTPIRARSYNLIQKLSLAGHQVTLATVWENEEERAGLEYISRFGVQIITEQLTRRQILINLARALLKRMPLQGLYSWQPILANKIAHTLTEYHPYCDIIHVEHLRGAIYGLWIKQTLAKLPGTLPIVWDSVDNISYLFDQAARRSQGGFGRWITRAELQPTRRYERSLATEFQRILVSSPVDRTAFEALCQTNPKLSTIEVITNGVDVEAFSPPDIPRKADTVIYSGKMSYHANVASAIFLIEKVMPLVWECKPHTKLELVGKDPTPQLLVLARADERIRVIGAVPELQPFLQQATVSAATLTYGAGVQLKILEAMACQTPVVTTSIAFTGLRAIAGQDLLVADEPPKLADHLLNLLADPALCQRIGENGRRYVCNHHNWEQIAKQLVLTYEDVINTHCE